MNWGRRRVTSLFLTAALALVGCGVVLTAHSQAPSTAAAKARIQLVSELIRELGILYHLQETSKREFAENPSSQGRLVTGIRVGSRTVLEMNTSIGVLEGIAIEGRWGEFRDLLKGADQRRIAIVQEMNQMAKALLEGPQPGINYGTFTARAPELTAQIEQVDKTMFTMAQALFFALVDDGRVGPDGNLHSLLLTKKERAAMIHLIDVTFGPALEDKNSSSIVSAGWIMKYGLSRPIYKAADEP